MPATNLTGYNVELKESNRKNFLGPLQSIVHTESHEYFMVTKINETGNLLWIK